MNDEENSTIMDNNIWILVDPLPEGCKYLVGCKWVYKKKPHQNGQLYKAKLVENKYSQIKGVNYEETFGSIIKARSEEKLKMLLQTFLRQFSTESHEILYG